MKNGLKILIIIFLIFNSMIISGTSLSLLRVENSLYAIENDFDPLIDINITVEIMAIRSLDTIDVFSDPDFFVKLFINSEEFTSPVENDNQHIYDFWKITKNVPDDIKTVDISIQLWDWGSDSNKLCDISKEKNTNDEGKYANITYDLRTGRWYGDDYNMGDSSGYGRLNGCGDGSIYANENDCELLFKIYQNDYDNDLLPYWIETNIYETDPMVNNKGEDLDLDGVPIEWEHCFGFNPNIWEDHGNFDHDIDSLNNIEEYLTWDFGSDPFRKDIFLQMDFMDDGPNGENNEILEGAYEILKDPYHRRNIIFHVDSGEINGGEIIPFRYNSTFDDVLILYNDYFLHNNSESALRGIFHYGLVVYSIRPAGFGFSGDTSPYWGYIPGTNGFVLSSTLVDKKEELFRGQKSREYLYASLIMHEMGHNFGVRFGDPFGCDNQLTKSPLQIGWWRFSNYKSCMNYRYTYLILDYSDGSHGKRDNDDWEQIDLTWFEYPGEDENFLISNKL